jgi:hypothetical protein
MREWLLIEVPTPTSQFRIREYRRLFELFARSVKTAA